MNEVFESLSAADTFELGKRMGESACPGDIICLNGDLGVGKTVFTKGVAAGLLVSEPVCSPTFTIMQLYEEGRLPLYHFDVYRIEDPEEMEELGYRDYFFGAGVTIIEWSERIAELIPESAINVTIAKKPEKGFDYRKITIVKGGAA